MPIALNLQMNIEIHVLGETQARGSSSKATDNSFHFRRSNPALPLNKANVLTAFQTFIGSKIPLALNVRWTQLQNSCRIINDAQDAFVFATEVNVGSIAGDSMPSLSAAYMELKTGLRGKSYRGSKHFGPLSESDTTIATDDLLNAAALVRFGVIASALLAGFLDADGNTWVPQIMSRTLSILGPANPTTVVASDVTAIALRQSIGTMVKRKAKSIY
jgi:hypothetical protein